MPALFRLLASAPVASMALAATLLTAAPARASVIYTYTGAAYAFVSGGGQATPADLYTIDDRVTGTIELAAPLAANLSFQNVTPTAFSFFDGVGSIDDTNATLTQFVVATNGDGAIVEWLVTVEAFAALTDGGTWGKMTFNRTGGLFGTSVSHAQCGVGSSAFGCALGVAGAYYQEASGGGPGQWRQEDVAVPEPTSLVLVGAALAGFTARRRASRTR
ncbi:hypothetical protein TBR22_A51130 [Luteitalea sp. TBR-22]|uniref:PEP-CTERM sorting domain-containing protein n=1 Tax=Luteitalea sp. TBR-22 TaxID=2802971 RepID=UPI001AFAED73|nr:PEP-CTERM sorting domain-containing protein [Luteitalea sp. TBR-22]BCS35878.1 hypothetical protein TBR22_A51130 [Luteitalea sp. TBR-22]